MDRIDLESLKDRIGKALEEDVGLGDITAESVVDFNPHAQAEIIARQDGIVAGLEVAKLVLSHNGPPLDIVLKVQDGDQVESGQQLMTIEGSGQTILGAERLALNLLGRLSGIATLTRKYVDAIEGTNAKILDTRKTTPLWRDLEKYAVRCGGGLNHRMGLYDMVLIKENHIRWAGGLDKAVQHSLEEIGTDRTAIKIEVEVRSLEELESILQYQVDRILLDNMSPTEVRQAVDIVRHKTALEVSGGITLESVRGYAETGVGYISVGELTHSPRVFDVSLLFKDELMAPGELAQ